MLRPPALKGEERAALRQLAFLYAPPGPLTEMVMPPGSSEQLSSRMLWTRIRYVAGLIMLNPPRGFFGKGIPVASCNLSVHAGQDGNVYKILQHRVFANHPKGVIWTVPARMPGAAVCMS